MNRTELTPRQRLILALDVDNGRSALEAVGLLKDHVGAFKIGFELFVTEGPGIVSAVMDAGGNVFLDLKFHDIPNTVAKASKAAARLGVSFFDVHASGGRKMMEAASRAAREQADISGLKPPVSLAVTVLTSMGDRELNDEIGVGRSPEEQVVKLARLAAVSGMDGVVASPKEVSAIREATPTGFIIVTPGVRPAWASRDDQKRVATPSDAVSAGADYLVIGRPILSSLDPVKAARMVAEELEGII
jgi:orotidine-5'-phosphate decarboxylase